MCLASSVVFNAPCLCLQTTGAGSLLLSFAIAWLGFQTSNPCLCFRLLTV
eukprot:GDKH01020288.1.p1 GENE.GDKH01020288.1~~GDKH01020288.1.p1  ORF type:complete len:50 (-),score=4.92 GDKH01020288.1:37-186(-)